jgi:hypothetical protein
LLFVLLVLDSLCGWKRSERRSGLNGSSWGERMRERMRGGENEREPNTATKRRTCFLKVPFELLVP